MKKIISMLVVLVMGIGIAAQETTTDVSTTSNNGAILESAEAEANASLTEAGKYERKSVTFINALWLMDEASRKMTTEQIEMMLKKVNEAITMPRFDYNPLPEAITNAFIAKANASTELSIDNIVSIMDEVVVPKILEIVDLNKELRAQNYTSEAQRNSFYATKAKEFGFTDVELAKIMNSAFIYIPLVSNFSAKQNDYCEHQCKMGVVWYRITTKGEKAKAIKVVAEMSSTMGMAKKNRIYKTSDGALASPKFAFRSMVKNGARNILAATQSMPEFRLSSQVIEKDKGYVGFDLGKKEGILIDDKYDICEFEEKEDGSIVQTKSGWVSVSMVADSNSKEGYKSKAYIVSGDPMTGAVLSEFPRIPIDIAIKFRTFPGGKLKVSYYNTTTFAMDTKDSTTPTGMGLQLDARYNIGRKFGVQQLFLGVGYGFGSQSNGGWELFAAKYWRVGGPFTVGPEAGFSVATGGPFFGLDVGYALSPTFKAELGGRYDIGNGGGDPVYPEQAGVTIQAGLIWSPKALPWDPWDFFRGRLGF
jgi:hypothetical protein